MSYVVSYAALCLAIGILGHFVKPRWTVCASGLAIAAFIVAVTWPWIDFARDGVSGTMARLISGTLWFSMVSVLIFGFAFGTGHVTVLAVRSRRAGD
jgi:hypothetical protein